MNNQIIKQYIIFGKNDLDNTIIELSDITENLSDIETDLEDVKDEIISSQKTDAMFVKDVYRPNTRIKKIWIAQRTIPKWKKI